MYTFLIEKRYWDTNFVTSLIKPLHSSQVVHVFDLASSALRPPLRLTGLLVNILATTKLTTLLQLQQH